MDPNVLKNNVYRRQKKIMETIYKKPRMILELLNTEDVLSTKSGDPVEIEWIEDENNPQ